MLSVPPRYIRKLLISIGLILPSISVHAATLTGSEGDDTVYGTKSADTINGRIGNDTLYGRDGDDYILGGGDNDTIEGGPGNDTLIADQPSSQVSTVVKINGGDGNDQVGFAGVALPGSMIDGGPGIDRIQPAYGIGSTSNMDGGDVSFIKGFEVWDLGGCFNNSECPIYLSFTGQGRIPITKLTENNLIGVEGRLTVYTVSRNGYGFDASAISSNGITFKVRAYDGNSPFGSEHCSVSGTQSDDTYDITASKDDMTANDFFCGNGGNDYFNGGYGSDIAEYSGNASDYTVTEITYNTLSVRDNRPGSPDGTDTLVEVNKLKFADSTVNVTTRGLYIVGDDGPDELDGTPNADLIDGKGSSDIIGAGDGNDIAIGGGGNDTISGDGGADNVDGGSGDDKLIGGNGDDTLKGGSGKDALIGGSGTDYADYSTATAAVVVDLGTPTKNTGDASGDTYNTVEGSIGSKFADTLAGSTGNNSISGGAGNDSIMGLGGQDQLIGGGGSDNIDLGSDTVSDVVVYQSTSDTPLGASRDQVKNFKSAQDKVDLSAIDADKSVRGDQAFQFTSTTPTRNSVWFVKSGSDIVVRGDVDGNTTPDFEILVKGTASVTASNFRL